MGGDQSTVGFQRSIGDWGPRAQYMCQLKHLLHVQLAAFPPGNTGPPKPALRLSTSPAPKVYSGQKRPPVAATSFALTKKSDFPKFKVLLMIFGYYLASSIFA